MDELDPMQLESYRMCASLIRAKCLDRGSVVLMHESVTSVIMPAVRYLEIKHSMKLDNTEAAKFIAKDVEIMWHYIIKHLAPKLVIKDTTLFDNLPTTCKPLMEKLREIYNKYVDCTKCDDLACEKHPTNRN